MLSQREEHLIRNMRDILRERFELFDENHKVDAKEMHENKLWVGYSISGFNFTERVNYFDLNIIGDICYLLHIELEKKFRGKGYGRQIYSCVEEFARRERCSRVRMMPSGTTFSGETRRDYMHKLGYTDIKPDGEVEKLFNIVHSDA